jgi:type I restriction-modification system DNA methylase subunit
MFEQTFKNIDDILHKDAGCGSELDYVEQTSWVLFLKYLDDLEKDKATAAELTGKVYTNIIDKEYQWNKWAAPKDKEGKLDHHKALTGDDLSDFVNIKLFPYLKKFKADAESADTIEYKIGEIFSELKNRIQSGYNLREVINRIDELRFRTHAEKHEMSHLYEDKIKNMGNAGRNGGEYYTPRPLIKTIVKVVAPKVGNKIYDGAVGSAGFLVEAYDYLRSTKNLTTKDVETLQKKTFYGKEKKSLAYIIGTMNMILHGVEAPNIVHTNTLAENLADILEKLDEAGFGKEELTTLQKLIDAEKSDLFDVLEYVFNSDIKPMTREARVAAAQATIFALLNDKQKEFIAFVLSKYIEIGVEELDQEKLPILLTNKYQSLEDAKEILGDVANISRLFIEFQQHLYKQKAA